MMKMRQQQQIKGTSINMSKQTALLIPFKRPIGNGEFAKDGLISMATFGVNEYERDESPVSVISHSATIVSQPSSACTSMEHQFNHHISNPNSNNRQRIALNRNHEYPFSQSMGTSGASTSEDDSSANYDISSMSIAVSLKQEDPSQQAQQHASCRKGVVRKSTTDCLSERVAFTHETSAKALNRSSSHAEADRVTDLYNSDDDDQMISIDFRGLQEEPMVLRENFLKSYGNKLIVEDQKHAVGATLKQFGEWKEEHIKLNRSTSDAHKEIIVARPIINSSATKVVSHANSNPRKEAPRNMRKHEEEPLKGPLKLAKPSNTIPSLINRQRSINSTKLGVPSKWDDAEKWLCYDNHQRSYFNKVKSSSTYRQTLHSIPSSGGRMFSVDKELKCTEDCASPNRGGFNVKDKAFECRSGQFSLPSSGKLNVCNARECKDYVAHGAVANRPLPHSTNLTSCSHSSIDATSGDDHVRASQSSSSNEVVENVMLAYGYLDTLKRKWNEVSLVKAACQKDVSDYMSSGEIAKPHFYALNQKLAAISVSDGELDPLATCRIASHMSASTGSMPGEMKAKEVIRPASTRNWIRSKSDALGTPCTWDYSSSGGGTMSRANQQNVATGICASDGEACENYASDQQFKIKGSYTQSFKQHHILQKLRRKCSPRKGVSAITPSGKAVEEDRGGHTDACLQKNFVVQTPTHGRSASMKDACTEVSPSLSTRDIGTQMTPPASSPITPKCTTPLQNTSPARHNTPTRTSPMSTPERNDVNFYRDDDDRMSTSAHRISRCDNGSALEFESCHWAKLELREPPSGAQTSEKNSDLGSVCNDWSPGHGLEEVIVSKDGDEEGQCAQDEVNSGAIMVSRAGALEARAAALEDAERAKFNAKFKREEARIKAWENLQKAKAEADLKKLEVKLERLRSKATEKVLNRVAAAESRAEEMRATAEAQQAEQMRKMREKACNLRKNALFPGSFAVCFARNYMP